MPNSNHGALNFKHASNANNNTKEKNHEKIDSHHRGGSIPHLARQPGICLLLDGYWGGPMGGPTAMINSGNYQNFYTKTAQLRQDLAAKQGEYNALMATSDPDSQRTADLSREISILHDKLTVEASSYNLPSTGTYGHTNGYAMMGGWGGCW